MVPGGESRSMGRGSPLLFFPVSVSAERIPFPMARSFLKYCRQIFSDMDAAQREQLVALTCVEAQELENVFALLLLGSFVGHPAPPTFLAVELLPFMEKELKILNRRAEDASDMLAEMIGVLGAD
jgi:hypothetical protein